MALTDNQPSSADGNARPEERLPAAQWKSGLNPASLKALARLPQIHAETRETTSLARFLRSGVGAGAVLMALGGLAVIFAGGASLRQEFAWSLLVLAGVGAMLRSYIKSIAQAFDRAPLREAAKDLRAILFYVGFAWGAGAFLLLGNNPMPIIGLGFAVLPGLLLAPLLRDRAAVLGFMLPVTVLTGAAILLRPWGDAAAALVLLLIVQGSIAAGIMLATRTGHRQAALPAGLSLR